MARPAAVLIRFTAGQEMRQDRQEGHEEYLAAEDNSCKFAYRKHSYLIDMHT